MRLRAAGAVPGRVGKCPACGAWLRVPDEAPAPVAVPPAADRDPERAPAGYALGPAHAVPSAYASAPSRTLPEKKVPAQTTSWKGVLPTPRQPETRLRES